MVAVRIVMVGICAALAATSVGCSYPRVWVESSETLTLSAADTRWVDIETHNGEVRVEGRDGDDEIVVKVNRKAGGLTQDDAGACLAAIELVNELNGDRRNLGWKWGQSRRRHWSAVVGFELQVPVAMAADVSTHNGSITVTGVSGECRVDSHNGAVAVTSGGERVRAATHNGPLTIDGRAGDVDAETHNGRLRVSLAPAGSLTGRIESHNGSIQLDVGKSTSVNLDCRTHNGGVDTSLALDDVSVSRRHLRGRHGEPTGTLRVETHNGSITVK